MSKRVYCQRELKQVVVTNWVCCLFQELIVSGFPRCLRLVQHNRGGKLQPRCLRAVDPRLVRAEEPKMPEGCPRQLRRVQVQDCLRRPTEMRRDC